MGFSLPRHERLCCPTSCATESAEAEGIAKDVADGIAIVVYELRAELAAFTEPSSQIGTCVPLSREASSSLPEESRSFAHYPKWEDANG